jgi:hypothetical protein
MKQAFWLVVSVVVIAMAMATIYYQRNRTAANDDEIRLLALGCDVVEQGCVIEHQGEQFQLQMTRPQGLKPFHITFTSSTSELARVSVQFDMLGMDMQQPTQSLQQTGAAIWQNQAILPICSSGRSDWVAWIRFRYQGSHYRLQFPFTVY